MLDVVVIGGGASGLFCAAEAGAKGLQVLVLEQGPKVGLKILVSGGGRCNFTNLYADPQEQFLSKNPHFCISAMRRFTPADFITLVEQQDIAYHERKHGQLFCDVSAKQIVAMLVERCTTNGVDIRTRHKVISVSRLADGSFLVATDKIKVHTAKVVLASGGLSMPKIASDVAYLVARNFKLDVVPPCPALVPLTWNARDKAQFQTLSGIAVEASASCRGTTFRENLLFTHRGLSGPVILQISSYWQPGDQVTINLLPDTDAAAWLLEQRHAKPQQQLWPLLKTKLPNRVVDILAADWFANSKLGSLTPHGITQVGQRLNHWPFMAGGTEGYRTAEVTLGGIDTNQVSSKTFEVKSVPGLYAIGEALDVTGWLGGFNFQWAWASGWCCGQQL